MSIPEAGCPHMAVWLEDGRYVEKHSKVEYSLTTLGQSISPVLKSLCDWGVNYQTSVSENRNIKNS